MTSTWEPSLAEQEAMADYLTTAVVHDATGEADGDRWVGEPPSARYYLATLAPQDLDLSAGERRRGREAPSSAGFEFEVADPRAELEIRAVASCYYKVLPRLDEQLKFAGGQDDPADRGGREYRLAPVFRRLQVDTGPLAVRLDPSRPLQQDIGLAEFTAEFARAARTAEQDPQVERREGDERRERFVPGDALASPAAFSSWLGRLPGDPVVPEWSARVSVLTRPVAGDRIRVMVALENLSADPTVARRGRIRPGQSDRRHDDDRDHFLFRIHLEVAAAPRIMVPIEMDLGPDAYRYDPLLPAYAANCGVEADRDGAGRIVRLRSVPAPIHQTHRTPARSHPSTGFADLADRPLAALERLLGDLRAYADSPEWGPGNLKPELAERKARDRAAFALEVARFEDGVRWLREDERLGLAFRLANRAMMKLGELAGRGHEGWRLFQLVFIVSQLPALAWREHDPAAFTPGLWGDPGDVDPTAAATVVWYPTGGGKTEAYLGLVACAMFYDRARGKRSGVTAWCRFPLRLLSLQQAQRQLDLVAAADEVRVAAAQELRAVGGDPGDRFALAYFAGEANTPNSLSRDQHLLDRLITDPKRRREVRVVDRCPYCPDGEVEVLPPDPNTLRLVHACTAPGCGRELPLYVVDAEVYRYLPAVVVGTLDKLAMIGLSDRFGALLGDVDCECALHGFGRGMKCHERRAKGHPDNTIRPLATLPYDASPTLEIVDELHMVDEELGAFSGHYEGLLAVVQHHLGTRTRPDGRPVRMKVIATTATIRGEDRQCEHLFGLRSVVVPLPGPSLKGSFYWRLDETSPLRRFVGIMPNRITAELTMVRMLQAAHRAIRRLQAGETPPSLADLPSAFLDELIDQYRVSLTYVTSLVDFRKLVRSMDTQVNEWLRQHRLREVPVAELSGDSKHDQVRAALDDLLGSGPTEAVIGTSMVSHGLDAPRLNLMIFNGMPKSMAEYIQSSSRVGRRYLGVVFMIFNPIRERDRSHFRYHDKFHEYMDRMVEPVAINRWSRYAARKTLPGVLMGEILQSVNRAYWEAGRAPTHLHDLVRMQQALRPPDRGGIDAARPDALLAALRKVYLTDRGEAAELRSELEQGVQTAVSSIRSAGAGASAAAGVHSLYRGTADYLGLEYPPMTSLRDVAEGLPFFTLAERRRP
jgi:hypothetical protein